MITLGQTISDHVNNIPGFIFAFLAVIVLNELWKIAFFLSYYPNDCINHDHIKGHPLFSFLPFFTVLPILPVNLIFFTILPVNLKPGKSSTLHTTQNMAESRSTLIDS